MRKYLKLITDRIPSRVEVRSNVGNINKLWGVSTSFVIFTIFHFNTIFFHFIKNTILQISGGAAAFPTASPVSTGLILCHYMSLWQVSSLERLSGSEIRLVGISYMSLPHFPVCFLMFHLVFPQFLRVFPMFPLVLLPVYYFRSYVNYYTELLFQMSHSYRFLISIVHFLK